jgi:hypothetical protein
MKRPIKRYVRLFAEKDGEIILNPDRPDALETYLKILAIPKPIIIGDKAFIEQYDPETNEIKRRPL